ncbi:beta strand repeat-containing protein, partial [Helicobacter pullorum]|uniref:beta strand repeat-containing protein n=1 Tax=Helicobacter pullorum TaxID=35818 RepID=UPI0024312FB0
MKLESSPKLDSKTSQKSNKESESKQPKKIQKAKNTCDSKKPTKSKNSSKLKSFIRTIPISIALASALSSQAVAGWNSGSCVGTTCTVTSNVSRVVTYTDGNNFKNLTINAGVTLNFINSASGTYNALIGVGGSAGIITNYGTLIGGDANTRILSMNDNASIAEIINTGLIQATYTNFEIKGSIGSFVNQGTGTITNAASGDSMWRRSILYLETPTSKIGDISFEGSSLTSAKTNNNLGNIVFVAKGANGEVIKSITAKDNADLEGNFAFDTGTIGNITFQDSASMTGNISLNGSSRISKILIDGSNSGGSGNGTPKLDGDITLNTSNGITNGITIANGGTLDGNINAQNSSRIGGIVVDNGSLIGNISLTNNSRIQGGIVLDNSANMTGNISLSTARNRDNITIDSINIGNGSTMTGDISVLGNSKITDSITIAGILDGNVSAIWNTGGNGTINQMDISGEITKKVQLDNETKIATLNLNGGTITGGINFQEFTTNSNNDIATIVNLTLNSDAYIGGIDIGNTSGGNAKGVISNLTLNGTSSIGSIVNNRGTISNLTLNGTSSIGTIANSATIANLNLSENGTITNGITNASGGTISNITLASSNTIHNGITNNGNIGEITSNLDN